MHGDPHIVPDDGVFVDAANEAARFDFTEELHLHDELRLDVHHGDFLSPGGEDEPDNRPVIHGDRHVRSELPHAVGAVLVLNVQVLGRHNDVDKPVLDANDVAYFKWIHHECPGLRLSDRSPAERRPRGLIVTYDSYREIQSRPDPHTRSSGRPSPTAPVAPPPAGDRHGCSDGRLLWPAADLTGSDVRDAGNVEGSSALEREAGAQPAPFTSSPRKSRNLLTYKELKRREKPGRFCEPAFDNLENLSYASGVRTQRQLF